MSLDLIVEPNIEVFEFENKESCENALLEQLNKQIKQQLEKNQHCALALAGGNTPKPLYSKLSESPQPWQNVNVTLTDERWVNSDHDDSNEKMLNEYLLKHHAQTATLYGLKNSEANLAKAEETCNQLLNEHLSSLDVSILGMGDDGHFASIFPGVANQNELLDLNQSKKCFMVKPEGKQIRISLTLSYLLSSKVIYVFLSGNKKKAIIDNTLELVRRNKQVEEGSLPDGALPIFALLNQKKCPVHIYWSA